MNALEEKALVEDLRRGRDHVVRSADISCTVEQYRSAARKIGHQHGWRIRTFPLEGEARIVVVWADREPTELEQRAVMEVVTTGRNYDEVLQEVRRQNLRPVED